MPQQIVEILKSDCIDQNANFSNISATLLLTDWAPGKDGALEFDFNGLTAILSNLHLGALFEIKFLRFQTQWGM